MFQVSSLIRRFCTLTAVLGAGLILAAGVAQAQTFKPQHKAFSQNCAACHTQENAVSGNVYVIPSDKACLACHQSYEAVAAKTAKLPDGEPNPHASHHYGKGITCTACHSEHSKSTVYCNNCHEFKYQIK